MRSINLVQLSGTKLFQDVLAQRATIFPRTEVTSQFAAERALAGPPRSRLTSLVESSMSGLELSSKQQKRLLELGEPNSVVVTTGQQVGFLGGPLYTLLKIRTAVQRSHEIENELGVPTIPVFWLEDNDHDAAEASTTSFLSHDPALVSVTHWDGSQDRQPVWQRVFDEGQIAKITDGLGNLSGQFAAEVQSRMLSAYSVGTSWGDAFLAVIEPFLQEWGVLVVRGSTIVNEGMHAAIVHKDLRDPGALSSIIKNTGLALQKSGYNLQASVSDLMFFIHDETGRHRLDKDGDCFSANAKNFTIDELRSIAKETPSRFSPSALARPIVQDAILPTVASILGAAEIAYHAQITDAYSAVGIAQPVPFVRHHAVLLDRKTERNLEKVGADIELYFDTWEEVERKVSTEYSEDILPLVAGVDELILPWRTVMPSVDPTLVKRVEATATEITAALNTLNAKAKSALKKKNQTILNRHNGIWWFVNPNGTRNERVFPLAFWMAVMGTDALRIIVESICSQSSSTLLLAGPSDTDQDHVE